MCIISRHCLCSSVTVSSRAVFSSHGYQSLQFNQWLTHKRDLQFTSNVLVPTWQISEVLSKQSFQRLEVSQVGVSTDVWESHSEHMAKPKGFSQVNTKLCKFASLQMINLCLPLVDFLLLLPKLSFFLDICIWCNSNICCKNDRFLWDKRMILV